MTMAAPPDDDGLDAWVRRSFPAGTRFSRDALVEMRREEMDWNAKRYAESIEGRRSADIARRLKRLEDTLLSPHGDLSEMLIGLIARIVADERRATTHAIDKAIDAAFAERAPMAYRGVWDEAISYDKGSVVTHSGGLWIALTATAGEKPNKSVDWRLAVKSGTATSDPGYA